MSISNVVFSGAILQNPTAAQTVTGFDLKLSTASLIVDSASSVKFGSSGVGTPDTGISRSAAGVLAVGNGTQGDASGTASLTNLAVASAGVAKWSTDTGISRASAGVVAIGNGTAGDTTGNLQLNLITKYNGVSTVGAGVPFIVAKATAASLSANTGPITLYTVPSNAAGMYRVNVHVVLQQAATSSSTLPSMTITWKEAVTGTTITLPITTTSAANTVGTQGPMGTTFTAGGIIDCLASSNITFSTTGYASSGATSMLYAYHVKLEFLGN